MPNAGAQNSHTRVRRIGRRPRVHITLAGKRHPELESEEVVHDRRPSNDNVPLNTRVVPIDVPDPYSLPGESEEITVICSLRNDPLRWLHFHGHIDDVGLPGATTIGEVRVENDLARATGARTCRGHPHCDRGRGP